MNVCVCVCACVWVWDSDRFPTWKWLAIIRHAVTRGYVRQLKLCFLTETWFMLLVVTVTTSKRDRKQTQTKGWRNQCWLNTAILLIPSASQTAVGLSAVEVNANSEDFWSYWADASVSVAFAGSGWGCRSYEGGQRWAHFAVFPATSLVFCRRLRELWAELALLLYFLSYSCWERLEPKQLLAPLQLTLLQSFL